MNFGFIWSYKYFYSGIHKKLKICQNYRIFILYTTRYITSIYNIY